MEVVLLRWAIEAGKLRLRGVAYHWAVEIRVDNEVSFFYEVTAGIPGDDMTVSIKAEEPQLYPRTHDDTEIKVVGTTSKTFDEMHLFCEKWVRRNPMYSVTCLFGANCQTFGSDFVGYLIDGQHIELFPKDSPVEDLGDALAPIPVKVARNLTIRAAHSIKSEIIKQTKRKLEDPGAPVRLVKPKIIEGTFEAIADELTAKPTSGITPEQRQQVRQDPVAYAMDSLSSKGPALAAAVVSCIPEVIESLAPPDTVKMVRDLFQL